ncbi:MAG: hypothetical protein NVS9B1_01380 [Candidatus Dormibacteraceae bacterium]
MSITTDGQADGGRALPRGGELVALAAAMAEINSRVELDEVLRLGVQGAATVLDAELAVITAAAEEGFQVATGRDEVLVTHRDSVPETTFEGRALAGGQPLIGMVEDPVRDLGVEVGQGREYGPALALGLASGGVVIGSLLALRGARGPAFGKDDLVRAQLIASSLAAAIRVARLFEQTRADARRMEALLASTEAMWRPTPFVEVAATVAEQAARLLPGIECLISMVPPERPDRFRIVAGSGPWAGRQINKEWPWLGSVAGEAMAGRRVIESTALMARSALRSTLEAGAIDTGRLIPLTTGRELPDGRLSLGVIGFYRAGSRPFTDPERQLMDEFGKRVSLTLHRAELLEAANRTAERLKTGIDVTLELAAALDHRELMGRLLRRAADSGEADRANLCRVERGRLVVEEGYDRDGRSIGIGEAYAIPPGSPVDLAITTRLPQFTPEFDVSGLPDVERERHAGTSHTAVIPLTLGDEMGAVLMLMRRRDHPFTTPDSELLQLIGNAAAVSLRNARLYAEAAALSQTKSDFMNLAAHELRTPLSVISGYLSMLEDGTFGPPPAEWTRPVSVIRSKTAELAALVEDLLIAARIEAGTMPTVLADVDLREVVADSLRRCEPRAALFNADIRAELPDRSVLVRVDPDHVGRILDNLVNNALTYATGPPWVRVAVQGPVVTVRDRGVGVPEALRERIFERFYRVDHPELPRLPGTGLGLAISRDLAERLGGTLRLQPESDGSTFELSLPLAGPDPSDA